MKLEFLFVKGKDDFCQNVQQFKNFLLSNSRLTMNENILQVDHKELSYNIVMYEVDVSKEIIFHLFLEAKQEKEEDQVEVLQCAETILRRINDKIGCFQINTIWDDVSMYYGRKMYAPIVEVESLLRSIIYIFMLKNVGSKWLKEQSPEEVKNDIKRTLHKNKINDAYPDTDALVYADFITLGKFFFAKYSLKTDYQQLLQTLKTEEISRGETLNSLLEQYESKSNWDRYFADKITVSDLPEKWSNLYEYRNMVAHTKKISKEDYQKAKKITDELRSAFLKCIELLNTINVTEQETDAIEDVAEQTIAPKTVEATTYLWNSKKINDLISEYEVKVPAWHEICIIDRAKQEEILKRYYEKLYGSIDEIIHLNDEKDFKNDEDAE